MCVCVCVRARARLGLGGGLLTFVQMFRIMPYDGAKVAIGKLAHLTVFGGPSMFFMFFMEVPLFIFYVFYVNLFVYLYVAVGNLAHLPVF